MSRNILVIGGSYFAGRVFVETLAPRDSFTLHALNRGNRPLKLDNVKEIVCDRRDTDRLEYSLPPLMWDAVVDFCAYEPADVEALFRALPQNSIRHYMLLSSTSVYSDSLALPVKEDHPKLTGPQPELGPFANYGYQKWLTELELTESCLRSSIPYTVLRPAIIYGKYNYAPRESYFFECAAKSEPIVIPENPLALFQFVSVWDVAALITKCISNDKSFNKAFNLAADDLVSYRRVVDILEDITGETVLTRTATMDEIESQRIPLPYPPDKHLIYSGELIGRMLDYQYTHFAEGLRRTYRHFMQSRPDLYSNIHDDSGNEGAR